MSAALDVPLAVEAALHPIEQGRVLGAIFAERLASGRGLEAAPLADVLAMLDDADALPAAHHANPPGAETIRRQAQAAGFDRELQHELVRYCASVELLTTRAGRILSEPLARRAIAELQRQRADEEMRRESAT